MARRGRCIESPSEAGHEEHRRAGFDDQWPDLVRKSVPKSVMGGLE